MLENPPRRPRAPRRPLSKRVPKINRGLIRRLRELMEEQGYNGSRLAAKAGLGQTAIYDILQAKSQRPTYDVLVKICKVLQVDIAYLLGISDDQTLSVDNIPKTFLPVIGVAKTGAWSPMLKKPPKKLPIHRLVQGPLHPRYPNAPHFGLEIVDDSMDAAQPVPMVHGMIVFCVDMAALNLPVRSGQIYAIKLVNADHNQEQTIFRRVMVTADGYELRAESNSGDTDYPPLAFHGKLTSDPGAPVCAFGLPYQGLVTFKT